MISAHDTAADPFEEIADILPKLARNIGWLKMMGEALIEQKGRQRLMKKAAPVSPEQSAHLDRKRAARTHSKQRHRGYRGLALAILSPRPSGRGVVISATG